MSALRPAPDWRIAHWLNTPVPLSVAALRGKAILAVAVQMLCPVGIDAQSDEGVPQTMRAYQMQGTPTTILIDRAGKLRLQKFGHVDDLRLGAAIQAVIGETGARPLPASA